MGCGRLSIVLASVLAAALPGGCGEPAWRASAAPRSDRTGPGTPATRFGRPLSLQGRPLKVGDAAPDVVLDDRVGGEVRLSSLRGKVVLISVVPDINTPVCASTTRRLDEAAPRLGDGVAVVTVSADSPFVQDAWCRENECSAVRMLSDRARRQFGQAFGVTVAGEDVLARSMFVIGRDGTVRHVEVVGEQSDAPDEAEALGVVRRLQADR